MSDRIRVYELSRELGLTNQEMIDLLKKEGVEVKSHASAIDGDTAELVRQHIIASRQKKGTPSRPAPTPPPEEKPAVPEAPALVADEEREIGESGKPILHLKPPIIVRDLATALGCKPNELIGELMMMNVFAAINQVVEPDIVRRICDKRGFEFVAERREKITKGTPQRKARGPIGERRFTGKQISRPPVVAFLCHVDHGKTSLLDAIRESRVAYGEAGGITQHIGASVVEWKGQKITFLDTPGHEAFAAMRARGANATDVLVLVVAADDGVMPQTKEAISHARAAGCPMIVAMNKIDLPNANPDKVLLTLQQNDVMAEEWGGEVGLVRVLAITRAGIDDLLERILLEAEIMELKGSPEKTAEGVVLEAQLETGMGPTAHILVRDGTLHTGDVLLCGPYYGRIKALIDQSGQRLKSAGPSCPVKVVGLSGAPDAGQKIEICPSEKEAKTIADERMRSTRQGELSVQQRASLEDLFRQISEESRANLKLILKTDVRGSLEAIVDSLNKQQSEKIRLDVISKGVGEITENDILLAATANAIVVGFHVRVMPQVQRAAKQQGVEVRLYSIIYELLEDIQAAMRGRLEPELRETALGQAEIKQIFNISKTGKICGCIANTGTVRVGASARVRRQGEIIYNGMIQNLRHFKDDVKEIRAGQECGIRLDNFEDFEVGDTVEVFVVDKVAPTL